MKILNASRNNLVLADKVEKANSHWQRLRGLLGRKSLAANEALWIPACNSIHTFFMQFTIDAIFVDKNWRVCAVYPKLQPWRVTRMIWSAQSVVEFAGGALDNKAVEIGDQLNVVS